MSESRARFPTASVTIIWSASIPVSEILLPGILAHGPPRKFATKDAASVLRDRGVYLDFADAIARDGKQAIRKRYGNLFHMYQRITGEDPYTTPMRIYPAPHYAMGGLWVDYNLMSNIPGLFVIGEANFSDHGANRLGASALMQGLADGYFVLPYTIGDYLAGVRNQSVPAECSRVQGGRIGNERPDFTAVQGQRKTLGGQLPSRTGRLDDRSLRDVTQRSRSARRLATHPATPRAVLCRTGTACRGRRNEHLRSSTPAESRTSSSLPK